MYLVLLCIDIKISLVKDLDIEIYVIPREEAKQSQPLTQAVCLSIAIEDVSGSDERIVLCEKDKIKVKTVVENVSMTEEEMNEMVMENYSIEEIEAAQKDEMRR